jgi:hypothetical protein
MFTTSISHFNNFLPYDLLISPNNSKNFNIVLYFDSKKLHCLLHQKSIFFSTNLFFVVVPVSDLRSANDIPVLDLLVYSVGEQIYHSDHCLLYTGRVLSILFTGSNRTVNGTKIVVNFKI